MAFLCFSWCMPVLSHLHHAWISNPSVMFTCKSPSTSSLPDTNILPLHKRSYQNVSDNAKLSCTSFIVLVLSLCELQIKRLLVQGVGQSCHTTWMTGHVGPMPYIASLVGRTYYLFYIIVNQMTAFPYFIAPVLSWLLDLSDFFTSIPLSLLDNSNNTMITAHLQCHPEVIVALRGELITLSLLKAFIV